MPTVINETDEQNELLQDDLDGLCNDQTQRENQFNSAVKERGNLKVGFKNFKEGREEAFKNVGKIAKQLKDQTFSFGQGLRQNPLAPDNLQKVQEDRTYLEDILHETLDEICSDHSFDKLIEAVNAEKKKKTRLMNIILKEEESRKRIKMLQKRIVEVKKERELEISERDQMIAHLKDQLQEMKAKTHMEGKYIRKCAEVQVAEGQKRLIKYSKV